MALTGKLGTIDVGPRQAGMPEIVERPEGSSQTFGVGAPVKLSGGYIVKCATNDTVFYGFAVVAAQNGASDGAKTSRIYRLAPGHQYEGTLSVASWDQSLVGSHVGFQTSGSTAFIDTANATQKFVIQRLASDLWSAGDNKPRIYFSVMPANIQDEV